ncbi:hypothetical protein Trydic_g6684, partial [Trypoxylus dichotomus]
MSQNPDGETQIAETSQPRYNTRKRKLSEEKEVVKDAKETIKPKDEVVEKSEKKKLKTITDEEEKEEVLLVEAEKLASENGEAEIATENNSEPVEQSTSKAESNDKSSAAASERIITRSRKRKLSDESKEKDEKVKPETLSRKRKEREEEEKDVTVKKRRITKNECFCVVLPKKPDYSTDLDAILTVEDWRLQKVQSPIALKHEDSNAYDNFDPLEFHGHWDDEGEASITNNGYT